MPPTMTDDQITLRRLALASEAIWTARNLEEKGGPRRLDRAKKLRQSAALYCVVIAQDAGLIAGP